MKKRLIALLLCLVMLVTCMGVGVDVLTGDEDAAAPETTVEPSAEPSTTPKQEESDLFAQLMATTTVDEYIAIANKVDEETASKFTEEQLAELEAHYAEIGGFDCNDIESLDVISNSAVAPLVNPNANGSSSTKPARVKSLRSASASTSNKETEDGHKGLFMNKNVTANDDGTYKITLESYVTGNVSISTQVENLPSDIALVLDVSGSMDEYINVGKTTDTSNLDTKYGAADGIYQHRSWGGFYWADMRFNNGKWQYNMWNGFGWKWVDLDEAETTRDIRVSKLNALKIATKNFVDQVEAKAAADQVDHKISVIKFAGDKKDTYGNDMYSGNNYSQIVTGLTSVSSGSNSIKDTINSLKAGGSTAADYGMQHAQTIINGVTRRSNKVVIMFTDGEPNHSNGFKDSVADAAITASKAIKQMGATVYTIGVFANANDTVPMPNDASKVNKYMHYVSSNFKNAESMADGGKATYAPNNKSYYLAAGNADEISGIFKQISEQISTGGASRTLDSASIMRDTVTRYFDMPSDKTSVKVYTAEYLGYESDGTTRKFAEKVPYADADVTISGQTLQVTNFDYSSDANCVTDTKKVDGSYSYSGKKLVVEFTVTANDKFFGGNGVPTNENTSGIYENGTIQDPVGTFVVPKTNVEIKEVTVTAKDKNVYYRNDVTSEQLTEGAIIKCGGMNVAEAEAWQKEYVCISSSASAISNIETDTDATITATVSSLDGANSKSGTATANVNVFTPVLTYKDSAIDLGETPDYAGENYVSTVWKHDGTDSTAVTMVGTAPTLELSYSPDAAAFSVDTYVTVTVKIGGKVADRVEFVHQKCDYKPCNFDAAQGQFIVHIKTFDLTITKSITSQESDLYGARDFVFNVKSNDGKTDIDVVVHVDANSSTGSTTIKGLPVGTYTITENHAWSWRYELKGVATSGTGSVNADLANYSATYTPSGTNNNITFTNSWLHAQWLSFTTSVRNIFGTPNNK